MRVLHCLDALEHGCKPYNHTITSARLEVTELLQKADKLDKILAIVNDESISNDSERMFQLCEFLESKK
ncbi:hypothetical protein KNV05_gp109 [Vibrio phage River4]|uniref:Uncharacterized protein n=1 Tax=Vibrio phage River4 TaxID=2736288 RepID=A0A6M9Z0D8_9CAUD|nr:hypothetical protein KNV05_gp003 [Vibrio phage River4]YP_010108032.1 hypothetical protein KNV05_gp109 [Vibrio phage River4]QKN84665.1 hypothetical protein RIVER4_3 [Vibrio phage River4]QKN84846.1 hypothetical protein RIVER4_207 [Vibrio phage River4]